MKQPKSTINSNIVRHRVLLAICHYFQLKQRICEIKKDSDDCQLKEAGGGCVTKLKNAKIKTTNFCQIQFISSFYLHTTNH